MAQGGGKGAAASGGNRCGGRKRSSDRGGRRRIRGQGRHRQGHGTSGPTTGGAGPESAGRPPAVAAGSTAPPNWPRRPPPSANRRRPSGWPRARRGVVGVVVGRGGGRGRAAAGRRGRRSWWSRWRRRRLAVADAHRPRCCVPSGARPAPRRSTPGCTTWSTVCAPPWDSPARPSAWCDSHVPNAMALGRDPRSATLVVTTGLDAVARPGRAGGRAGPRIGPHQAARHGAVGRGGGRDGPAGAVIAGRRRRRDRAPAGRPRAGSSRPTSGPPLVVRYPTGIGSALGTMVAARLDGHRAVAARPRAATAALTRWLWIDPMAGVGPASPPDGEPRRHAGPGRGTGARLSTGVGGPWPRSAGVARAAAPVQVVARRSLGVGRSAPSRPGSARPRAEMVAEAARARSASASSSSAGEHVVSTSSTWATWSGMARSMSSTPAGVSTAKAAAPVLGTRPAAPRVPAAGAGPSTGSGRSG